MNGAVKFVALVSTLLFAVPASAQEIKNARQIGGWFLADWQGEYGNPVPPYCLMNRSLPDGTRFELQFQPLSQALLVQFENEAWSSLLTRPRDAKGYREKVKLGFEWVSGSPRVETYDFTIMGSASLGMKPGLSYRHQGDLSSFLQAMAGSTSLKVSEGGRLISTVDLSGSKNAVVSLLNCGMAIAQKKGTDPFAR